MQPLATPAQLAERMGAPPDPSRVDAALTDASATVRAAAGQDFTQAVTDSTLRAHCCGALRLPQRPVNDVTDVTDIYGEALDWWDWDGREKVTVSYRYDVVVVTYDHGYAVIPDDIVAVTCNVAARTLASAPEDAGIQSRSITNYNESFGPVGAAGPAGLFNDERAMLVRYQRPGSSARLCR